MICQKGPADSGAFRFSAAGWWTIAVLPVALSAVRRAYQPNRRYPMRGTKAKCSGWAERAQDYEKAQYQEALHRVCADIAERSGDAGVARRGHERADEWRNVATDRLASMWVDHHRERARSRTTNMKPPVVTRSRSRCSQRSRERRSTRSSARSGDSGSSDGEPGEPPRPRRRQRRKRYRGHTCCWIGGAA